MCLLIVFSISFYTSPEVTQKNMPVKQNPKVVVIVVAVAVVVFVIAVAVLIVAVVDLEICHP